MIENDLADTAVHEAGHAVVALVLGLPFEWVSIIPGDDSLGGVLGENPLFGTNPDAWIASEVLLAEKTVVYFLAGFAADSLIASISRETALLAATLDTADARYYADLLARQPGSTLSRPQHVRQALVRAGVLVGICEDVVSDVVKALLRERRLSRARVEEIAAASPSVAQARLLVEQWPRGPSAAATG
ncbi:MAG: hypothetical protein AAB263_10605 [Planctomycetota bacterium]